LGKLVLFDIDGTLLMPSRAHKEAFHYALKRVYGVEVDVEGIAVPGATDRQIIVESLRTRGLNDKIIKARLKRCEEAVVEAYARISTREKVIEGAEELLESLDGRGFLIGLATGNIEGVAKIKMGRVGLGRYFRVGGFGNDHYDRGELIKTAVKRAKNVFGFEGLVVVVGDTPRDVYAAKKAGVKVLGVATGKYSIEELRRSGADYVAGDLKEASTILLNDPLND